MPKLCVHISRLFRDLPAASTARGLIPATPDSAEGIKRKKTLTEAAEELRGEIETRVPPSEKGPFGEWGLATLQCKLVKAKKGFGKGHHRPPLKVDSSLVVLFLSLPA